MRESRNKLTEKEMELARMLMSECNTTAGYVQNFL